MGFLYSALMVFGALNGALVNAQGQYGSSEYQPDYCGRQGLPCCPGFDDPGTVCQVNCTFTICAVPGFDAQCELPVEGDPDIGAAQTICRGCGQLGLKCCDGDNPSPNDIKDVVGGCGSRSGPAVCTATPDGPMCLTPTAGLFEKCGGEGYFGVTKCGVDMVCTYVNEYYSQCEFAGGNGVAPWGQCGGQGYDGPTNCLAGFACYEVNAFYSQCQRQ